ncbi:16S rRNA (adenine(1518)-N(6)/adenine(1519)-N(6))-dimethyltransferase RsmA [Thermodesulforhabdus norvegica]|uniref:Ribosomal RNA small subunit methyltransferase A n=1 Tax=Thermodesulforhabdus norvegica TaxID=39841 RepID=A0A1I4SS10_9BACT|nr:16S rRNA (adenine(1518)-N(6)/adenine(1519)-N(6))-dimethyltransferase RsmA [Thermodesulforhabdus norvegica]SFM67222.1 dimethyladenosine transferase [Thermodesulforhabdus norvegica]
MLLRPSDYFRMFSGRIRKTLGQHFLIQPRTAEKIVQALMVRPGDTVIEIGPGLGALTAHLIRLPCNLHLVELDADIAKALQSVMPSETPATVFWHIEDILSSDLLNKPGESKKAEKIKVIGNIPYSISSPLLMRLIENHRHIDRAVLMVQREVARRWTAKPGTREYGLPTVLLACCALTERLFYVGPGQFYPKPKVHSAVVKIKFFERACWEYPGWPYFRQVASRLFRMRRKTVLTILKSFMDATLAEQILREAGASPGTRPENLSPEEILRLARSIASKGQRTD